MVSEDGQDFLCMRVSSEKSVQMKDGEVGYIHRFGERPKEFKPYRRRERAPEINAGAIMAKWRSETTAKQLLELSVQLGVKASALLELRVAWSREHGAWGWPMRNGRGDMVGIRLRWDDGRKRCVTGSHNALFWPFCEPEKTAWIVEGGTDVAAALSIGVFAIGRPSCNGGLFDLLEAIKGMGIENAVIVADNDEDRFRPDGSRYNPGIDGANSLAERMTVPCCVMALPVKDMRSFVQAGADYETVHSIMKGMIWTKPTEKTNHQ